MMKKFGLLCLLIIGLFSGCGAVASIDRISETLQQSVPVLSEAKVGSVDLASVKIYYGAEFEYWKNALEDKTLLDQYKVGASALKAVTGFININLLAGDVKANYVGMENNGNVDGIFIYEFLVDVSLSDQIITDANALTTLLVEEKNEGEYFFVKGKYLATVDTSFTAEQRMEIMTKLNELII